MRVAEIKCLNGFSDNWSLAQCATDFCLFSLGIEANFTVQLKTIQEFVLC